MSLKLQESHVLPPPFPVNSNSLHRRSTLKRKLPWQSVSSLESNESPLTPEHKRVRRTQAAAPSQVQKSDLNWVALTAFSARLTRILTVVCQLNDKKERSDTRNIVFSVIRDALKIRFGKPEILVSALILLDRIQTSTAETLITTKSIRVIFGICVLLAAKFLLDGSIWNHEAYELLGISEGVNEVEAKVLEIMEWRVWIDPEEYEKYLSAVIGE